MIPFLRFPFEIQLLIALCTACTDDALGPPKHLPALFATCRTIYETLGRSHELHACIFRAKFDVSAAHRRFGPGALLSRNLASQLKIYCSTLKRIRSNDICSQTLETDLWAAFLMLTESDGKNFVQLTEYAHLPLFADRLVRARLREDRAPGGWPVENNVISLATWILWMLASNSALQAESDSDREALIRLLLPYVLCCFRYNCFHAPDIHYSLPLLRDETPTISNSLATAHGPYPQYPSEDTITTLTHFGHSVQIARPHIVQAAQLLYFARRELRGFHIPPNIPEDREHALLLGQPTGPTKADYREINSHPAARLLQWGNWDWRSELTPYELSKIDKGNERFPVIRALSARWDVDWDRLTGCYSPYAYPTSGAFRRYAWTTLVGQWGGRMLLPAENTYMAMIQNPELPGLFGENYPFTSMRPFLLTLREYHCISPEEPVEFRGVTPENPTEDGILNAYLPQVNMLVEDDAVEFTEDDINGEREHYRYMKVLPGQPSAHNEDTCVYCQARLERAAAALRRRVEELEPLFEDAGVGRSRDDEFDTDDVTEQPFEDAYDRVCHGVLDIVFTGLTEERHGNAWCHYMYYGRLREWDGLIVLIGVPNDVNERLWGRWIFRGYLHGGQNFTGRWRHYAYDPFAPAYEGAFTLSKREETS